MTTKKEAVPADSEGRVPEYLVERLAAGDLPPARADEVRRRLALEPDGAARIEGIGASNRHILQQHSPAAVADEVRRRAGQATQLPNAASEVRSARRGGWRSLGMMILPATAAAFALVLWLRSPADIGAGAGAGAGVGTGGGEAPGDTERIKGLQPSLRVYRKNAGKIERLKEGASAHAGDQLQVAYVAAGHRFGVVASVDGAGQVTYHLPAEGGRAVRLAGEGEVALPEAYELDAAPGFERFVLVVGDAPFDAAAVTNVIRGAGRSPAGTVAISFTVRKQ